MSDEDKQAEPKAAKKTGGAKLRVRILVSKTKANGFIYGKGKEILLEADKAEALEKLGKVAIVGV